MYYFKKCVTIEPTIEENLINITSLIKIEDQILNNNNGKLVLFSFDGRETCSDDANPKETPSTPTSSVKLGDSSRQYCQETSQLPLYLSIIRVVPPQFDPWCSEVEERVVSCMLSLHDCKLTPMFAYLSYPKYDSPVC